MAIQVDRHLFGSFDGYCTLATSPGVTPDESAELSEFSFGQTSDPSILNSLHERLCVLGRPLRSGRIAITRAFAGPPDDAGRPTIRLCTLVFTDMQFLEVRQGLAALLGDSKIWSVSGFEQGMSAEVKPRKTSSSPGADALHLVDWWMEMRGRRDLVLSLPLEDRSENAILSAVASVADIDSITLRWGLFLFSTSAAADVCTLAPLASRSMRRKVHELTLDVAWRHPQMEAWHRRGAKSMTLPSFHDLETGNLEIEPSELGSTTSYFRAESSGAKNPVSRLIALVAASVVILLLGSIAAMTFLATPESEPVSTVVENRPFVDPRGEVDFTRSGSSDSNLNPLEVAGGEDSPQPSLDPSPAPKKEKDGGSNDGKKPPDPKLPNSSSDGGYRLPEGDAESDFPQPVAKVENVPEPLPSVQDRIEEVKKLHRELKEITTKLTECPTYPKMTWPPNTSQVGRSSTNKMQLMIEYSEKVNEAMPCRHEKILKARSRLKSFVEKFADRDFSLDVRFLTFEVKSKLSFLDWLKQVSLGPFPKTPREFGISIADNSDVDPAVLEACKKYIVTLSHFVKAVSAKDKAIETMKENFNSQRKYVLEQGNRIMDEGGNAPDGGSQIQLGTALFKAGVSKSLVVEFPEGWFNQIQDQEDSFSAYLKKSMNVAIGELASRKNKSIENSKNEEGSHISGGNKAPAPAANQESPS